MQLMQLFSFIGMLTHRWSLVKKKDLRLAFGSSLMIDHEDDHHNALSYIDFRSSNYVSLGPRIQPHMLLAGILYDQPVVGDASHHRLTLEAQLRIRATARSHSIRG